MENINEILDNLGHRDSWEIFHLSVTNRGDGDREKAQKYLEKHGLSYTLYQSNWQQLHRSIFDLNIQLPDMIYKKSFEFITLLGGVTFEQQDFEQFKSCLEKTGDSEFLIIQDTFGMSLNQKKNALKMKYPSNISWDELTNGDFISTALYEASERDYYLFGNSGEWGIYVATEYIDEAINPAGTPIRIVGFDPKYRTIFRNAFKISEGKYSENLDYIPKRERPKLKEWVPKNYRN